MPADYTLRRAEKGDHTGLYSLLDDEKCQQHRHLDWHTPYDWLGYQPFWLLIKDSKIAAALSVPADPPGIAWVRLFAISEHLRHLPTWEILFQKVMEDYAQDKQTAIVSIALQKWYSDLLLKAGFNLHQYIVVLAWQDFATRRPIHDNIIIREMLPEDIPLVRSIDQNSFEPIWQNSLDVITRSYKLSNYSTVAEKDGKIVGFQISSFAFNNAHLARLAVLPGYQNQGIGSGLVKDLVYHFSNDLDIQKITVNTQNDNPTSLSLYKHLGFKMTGDRFPVYTFKKQNR